MRKGLFTETSNQTISLSEELTRPKTRSTLSTLVWLNATRTVRVSIFLIKMAKI